LRNICPLFSRNPSTWQKEKGIKTITGISSKLGLHQQVESTYRDWDPQL